MEDLCGQLNMRISNSSESAESDSMWTFRSRLGMRCRIDYILVSSGLQIESTRAVEDIHLGSDHRVVRTILVFTRSSPEVFRDRRKDKR